MKIFRHEYFGALVYDSETWNLTYLNNRQAENFLEENKEEIIIHNKPNPGFLSAPLKMFVDVFSGCNLRCKHCMIANIPKPAKEMDFNTIKGILEELSKLGVLEVRLSGGEPICRPDFFQIVEEAKKNNISVSVNSNGIWNKEQKNKMAESKIDRVHISLDGLEKQHDFIRGQGNFQKSLTTIKFLKSNGKYVRIVVCLFKDNLTDIDSLIKLAEELECDIKFSPIAKRGNAESMSRLLIIEECQDIKKYFDNLKSKVNVFFNYGTMIPEFNDYCDISDFDSNVCGSGRTQLRVEINGDVYGAGCGNLTGEKEPLGKIDNDFSELWKKSQLSILNDTKAKGGKCLDCDLSKVFQSWLSHRSPSFNFRN